MTDSYKTFAAIVVGALIAFTALMFFVTPVSANPSVIQRDMGAGCGVGVATTSVTYLTPGISTSTLIYDTQCGTSASPDSSAFLVQFTGSSTASTLSIAFEFSPGVAGVDCRASPTACDWYADDMFTISTTSPRTGLGTTNNYLLPFASTTVGGVTGVSSRTTRAIDVATPTRYIRAVLSLPAGSLNGAVYSEFNGKKQNP